MQIRQLLPGKGFCFYLLYTLIVLVFLLWLRFPVDAVRARVESDLNKMTPDFNWSIGKIGLSFPLDIRFDNIKIGKKNKGKKEVVLLMDFFSLRPDLAAWQKSGTWSAGYRIKMLKTGNIRGTLELTKDHNFLQCTATVQGIRLDHPYLGKIFREYDRTVSGHLSGDFVGTWEVQQGIFTKLTTDNVKLNKGKINLHKPILGMSQLVFDQLSGRMKYHGGLVQVNDGKMESRLFSSQFSGTLQPNASVSLSKLKLKGSLLPRSEFMASIGNATVENTLKRQLREGRLPFTITGSLKEPGIIFPGLPANLGKRLEKRNR
ncbi:MAG: type II secretion system protein GspN [Candidatus Electrothrix sp. AR3]|nr:type II secretion system protein GspN [Candidatus Electrothrix sp. AR3]